MLASHSPARRARLTSRALAWVGVLAVLVTPVTSADDVSLTGGVLLASALGWTTLAVPGGRTDQPRPWAAAPAVFCAAMGAVLLAKPSAHVLHVLDWVWPPALLGLVVVLAWHLSRQPGSRTRRWLPLVVVAALVAVAGGAETLQEAVDVHAHPMTGQLVDVGDHRLRLSCSGSGSPTVVLEPGLGEAAPAMSLVAPAVAADTRVCVYDRAGRGWSDPVDRPLDGTQTAADLHTLLHRAHVEGPYVLAGHSFGGLYVLAFAGAYPDEVAGLVLIDSTAPRPGAPISAPSRWDPAARLLRATPVAARLGLTRLWAQSSYDTLPAPARVDAIARASRPAHVRSVVGELEQGGAAVSQAPLVDLRSKPLIVLTAGQGHDPAWTADQDRLALLSRDGEHRVVADATHTSLVSDPNDAVATSRAVRDVVASARRD